MGDHTLPRPEDPQITRGAVKLMLDEERLPELDVLVDSVRRAHHSNRPVAVHCVTRAELVLAAGALAQAGAHPGDRIEHASIAPPDLVDLLTRLPATVVTQPGFIAERGDAYLRDVPSADQPWLYRCRGFLDAGIPLAAGTDAPFGHPDPWRAIRAAVDRRTPAGSSMSPSECLTPEEALALFTSPLEAPGTPTLQIAPGSPADLCLLTHPWQQARNHLEASSVRATILGDDLTYSNAT
jgi:predicted amidohydrolase YtcJ